jgi:hypothetical protein
MVRKTYYEDRTLVVSSTDVTIEGVAYEISTIEDIVIDKDDMNRYAFIGTVTATAGTLIFVFDRVLVIVLALITAAVGAIVFPPSYTVFLSIPPRRIEAFTSVRKGKVQRVAEAITSAKSDWDAAFRRRAGRLDV